MTKPKKLPAPPQQKVTIHEPNEPAPVKSPARLPDALSINLAMGTLTLGISVICLYILNKTILSVYHPDLNAILENAFKISMREHESFFPEPVERLQYQLSLISMPLIVYVVFSLINRKRDLLANSPSLSRIINEAGILALITFTYIVFTRRLLHIPGQTTSFFYINNLISKGYALVMLPIYSAVAYLLVLYSQAQSTSFRKNIVNIACYTLVAIIMLDIFLYNIFYLPMQERGRYMETNMLFYSISQVYAGKSLLVNMTSQYGLYAWFLLPAFKLIGLSVTKMGVVMAVLNSVSILFFYLGIRRIIKQDLLSLIVFLTLTWWLYWAGRMPFESTSRYYYQYYPIRILFPSMVFYLVAVYFSCREAIKKYILSLVALASAMAVLWNLDTGVVLFGAVTIAMLYSVFDISNVKNSIKPGLYILLRMGAAFAAVVVAFMVATKVHSGSWPDFSAVASFQKIYYISGYFMLPMGAVKFWNFPVIVYIVTCIYCVYSLRAPQNADTPVIVFLFILGTGIFSYFQGRSFDTNVEGVMYPAIILLGIFCSKLLPNMSFKKENFKFHESYLFFAVAIFILLDSAMSQVYAIPDIHSFAFRNATDFDSVKNKEIQERIDFVTQNIPAKDTALILAQDYESYYYASGQYYNPAHIPGSTEIFFKSEIYALLNTIRTTNHPIIYDRKHDFWLEKDTIVKTLAKYTYIDKSLPDKSMLLLRRGDNHRQQRLTPDSRTVYYANIADLNYPTTMLNLPDTFTLECYITLDSKRMAKDNLLFSNVSNSVPFSGMIMYQVGDSLYKYQFTYGNGSEWCQGISCQLTPSIENHILIKVQKNLISVFNNGMLCGQANTSSSYKNSDHKFYVNALFAGDVNEIIIKTGASQ